MSRVFTLQTLPNLTIVANEESRIMKKINALAALYGVDVKDIKIAYSDDDVVVFAIRKNGDVRLVKKPAAWLYGNTRRLTSIIQ